MTAYHQVFDPIFGVGCSISAIASFFAARKSGFVFPGGLLVAGVVAFWAALFIGSDLGYRAWQSIPDPPEQAFRDTAPLGALLFGWLPAGVFCGLIFVFIRLAGHLLSGGKTSSDPVDPGSRPVETGNPYQAPQSRHGG